MTPSSVEGREETEEAEMEARGEEEVTEETGDIGEAEVTEEEEEVTTGLLEKMLKDSLLSRTSKTTTQEAEAEEEAYDGNIYEVEDPSFGEEVTLEILVDVGEGEVTSDQAISQLGIMLGDEWINEEEFEWATAEAERLEAEVVAANDLSEEIVDYIMSDVSMGVADPVDAYYNIQDMIDDGTINQQDGSSALASLEPLVN